VIFGLGEKEDWTNQGKPAIGDRPATGWFKANPSLGHHLHIDKIDEEFQQAKNNPSQQNSFRRLRLNQWVGQEERYIPLEDWRQCADPFNQEGFVGKRCYAGMDLSATDDITAFVMVFERDGLYHWIPHFWIPEYEI